MLNGCTRDEAATLWREFALALADGLQSLQSSL
jgi:hypothetical protein